MPENNDKTQVEKKKIVLSGIQPTGTITLGNYLGAVANWGKMQEEFESVFFIADLHALTVKREPAEFRQACTSFFAQLLACGIDPEKPCFISSRTFTNTPNCNGFSTATPMSVKRPE